jgi:tetratricopeptide (TPR) repeat protein
VASVLRSRRRSRLVGLVLSATLTLAAPAMRAQPHPSYDALVREYAQGGAAAQHAVLEVVALPQPTILAMIAQQARQLSDSRQRAAVMLHTDTAYAQLLASADGSALFHVGAARRVFAAMTESGRGNARAQAFERRWFAFVAGMLTANSLLDRADFLIRDGLTLYPREPRLYVARGALQEMRVALRSADPRESRQITVRDRGLETSAADYRRAVEYDPMLAIAHLRLGWVHVMQHDGRARADIERGLAVSSEPVDRYLAYLMRGGLAERESRFEDAVGEYESARTIGPACQTPYIALARVETALGRPSRAREIIGAFTALAEKAPDPWWDFHLGAFDATALIWLRREAMAP